ncbi:HNH endonuclease [Streptomyces sp. NPDC059631]|uniref:HNH endonuclease n=1 Tax=unclassified Streptomyces TaxID=2593676 RepID=UPI0036987CF7
MKPDPTVLLPCLAVAVLGILCLAIGVGRKRRWRDPIRLFTWPQKQQLIRQANGQCEHKPPLWSRCPAPGTEADHIHPWCRGGVTELWNGQLLCLRHNRRKSHRVPSPLYRWRLARRRKRYCPPRHTAGVNSWPGSSARTASRSATTSSPGPTSFHGGRGSTRRWGSGSA